MKSQSFQPKWTKKELRMNLFQQQQDMFINLTPIPSFRFQWVRSSKFPSFLHPYVVHKKCPVNPGNLRIYIPVHLRFSTTIRLHSEKRSPSTSFVFQPLMCVSPLGAPSHKGCSGKRPTGGPGDLWNLFLENLKVMKLSVKPGDSKDSYATKCF